jgi:hypothetical protein
MEPFQSAYKKNHDFILLAEFSEVDGAVVLGTFPPKILESFDTDTFIKRVLASDHTSKKNKNGDGFHIGNQDDTHAYIKHGDFFSFVHYLSLRDV